MNGANSISVFLLVICTFTAIVWGTNINSTDGKENLDVILEQEIKSETQSPNNLGDKKRLWLIPSILSLFTTPAPPPPPPTPPPAIIFINLPPTPGSDSGNNGNEGNSTSTTTTAATTTTTSTTSAPDITSTPFPTRCVTDSDCNFILNGKYCKPNGICGCRIGEEGAGDCDATSFGTVCDPAELTCTCNSTAPQTCSGRFNGPTCIASIFGSTDGTGRIWNGCGCTDDVGCLIVPSFGPHCIDNKCKCRNGQNSECSTSGLGRACFYSGCGCQTNAQCDHNTFGPTCTRNICRCASDTDCVGNLRGSHCDLSGTDSDTFQQCTSAH